MIIQGILKTPLSVIASNIRRLFCVASLLLFSLSSSANMGATNYGDGADALAQADSFVITAMLYVQYMVYTFAAIFCIISALQIYIKINMGEEGVTKEITRLVGACLFVIGACVLLPAFFGFSISG